MITKTLLTADDLARMPDDASVQIELDEGELITMPSTGFEHGELGNQIMFRLAQHVRKNKLGKVVTGDSGFRLNDRTVLAPDVAFVRQARVESVRRKSFANGAPDLAVEIFSPSDGNRQSTRKVKQYLAADLLEAPDLPPGFSVKAGELFS